MFGNASSQWAQVDSTLRSLTDVACSATTAYAVGLIGTIVLGDETSRQIRATDVGINDLHGVSAVGDGALMVGTNGTVFILASIAAALGRERKGIHYGGGAPG